MKTVLNTFPILVARQKYSAWCLEIMPCTSFYVSYVDVEIVFHLPVTNILNHNSFNNSRPREGFYAGTL